MSGTAMPFCVVPSHIGHLSVVVGLPVELTSWNSCPTAVPPLVVPQPEPVPRAQYSSASWWKPWPPSCNAALGPLVFPPDHSIHTEPVFHQEVPFSTMECQVTFIPAGVFMVSCVCATCVLQLARRLVSLPVQLKMVAPLPMPSVWLTVLKRQMLTKFL